MRTSKTRAVIPDSARNGGLMIFAPPGWGKSRLLGRRICYQDARRGIGQVVIDVRGASLDYLLDRVLYEDKTTQLEIGERLRYCNMSGERAFGHTYLYLWPLLAKRYPQESLHTTVQRIVDLIAKTDRNLSTASIQGMNRLAPLLTSIGIVLTQLEEPLYKTFDLLDNPGLWQERLREASRRPGATEAVASLQTHFQLPPREQKLQTEVLRNKLSLLRFDPASRAMFSGMEPTIDWEEVAQKGLTVLLDLRGREPEQTREFKLFWVWNSLLEYIRARRRSDPPLALVIDELMFFVRHGSSLNIPEITQDFSELLSTHKRNANLWLSLATQEQAELPEGLLEACLTMSNQLYGATTNEETALERARRFDTLDPYKLKDSQVHFGIKPLVDPFSIIEPYPFTIRAYEPVGENKTFMSLEEQRYEASRKYKYLSKEDWFLGQTYREGDVPRSLRRITTRKLDPKQFVNEQLVDELRRRLMARDGVRIADVLAELDESGAAVEEKSSQDESLADHLEEKPKPKLLDRAREALKGNRPRRAGRRRYVEPE